MARTSKPTNGGNGGNGAMAPAKAKRMPIRKPNGDVVPDDMVAERAYQIYEARGGQHGADFDDWLEAERQLRQPPAPKSRKRSPSARA
jgi:hypothetical protein